VPLSPEVLLDAAARPDLLLVDLAPRELAVGRPRADFVEDLAVHRVGVALLDQALHHVDLLVDEVGGARVNGVVLDVELAAVAPERRDVPLGDVDGALALVRALHDAIVDVRVIDDAQHVIAAVLEVAAEDVPEAVGARMADVHRRVDRETARIDAHDLRPGGDERLLLPRERVMNLERHRPPA
jgi:hypothetical protein